MGLLEKLAGGALGFAVGGPLGAILGAVAGEAVASAEAEEAPRARPRSRRAEASSGTKEDRAGVFLVAVVSLLAKLAKADGLVSRREIRVIDEFLRSGLGLSGADRKAAIRIFEAAKRDQHSFEDMAIQIYQLFQKDRDGLRNLMGILMSVGAADGRWHPEVERRLQRVARIFDYADAEFAQLKALHLPEPDQQYQVLGVAPEASDREVRRAYKRLAKDFHPDRLSGLDLPPAFVAFAEREFRRIQEAYDAIEKARGR